MSVTISNQVLAGGCQQPLFDPAPPYGSGSWSYDSYISATTPTTSLEVEEEVVIEKEYDENGNVTKETRTVSRLRRPEPLRNRPPSSPPYIQTPW